MEKKKKKATAFARNETEKRQITRLLHKVRWLRDVGRSWLSCR